MNRILPILLLLLGCSENGDLYDDGRDDRPTCETLSFNEVNPANTSSVLNDEVEAALSLLCESDADGDLGLETYRSIVQGQVQIDTLDDIEDIDYSALLVFFELAADTPRETAIPIIEEQIDGYMWKERIYIIPGTTTEALATTLVHELNHVLNRSDENYYLPAADNLSSMERVDRLNRLTTDPGAAFREEYRAFYVEKVFAGAPLDIGDQQSMRELKQEVADLYELDIDVDTFPDVPEGVLVPDLQGWELRPESLCEPGLTFFPCD